MLLGREGAGHDVRTQRGGRPSRLKTRRTWRRLKPARFLAARLGRPLAMGEAREALS